MTTQFETIIGSDIQQAALHLHNGECVAMPTETVYGLAALAFNESAVRQVYRVKQRPPDNPLIVHLPDLDMVRQVAADVAPAALELLHHFAPGPLTVLLPKHPRLPAAVTAGRPHVAVRIPAHPMALALLRKVQQPIAAPSANLYTRISPTSAAHVAAQLGGRIPYILDGGPCTAGIESTIVGFDKDTVLVYRLGSIGLEALQQHAGKVLLRNGGEQAPIAPGMQRLHYAPRIPLVLTNNIEAEAAQTKVPFALINFSRPRPAVHTPYQLVLSKNANPAEAAQNLYAALHTAEQMPVQKIIAEMAPEVGVGRAINDRLMRAEH